MTDPWKVDPLYHRTLLTVKEKPTHKRGMSGNGRGFKFPVLARDIPLFLMLSHFFQVSSHFYTVSEVMSTNGVGTTLVSLKLTALI